MALKNLFDMVKADKYTADGREALIKAQEAETEDKVYQIGEISQKTGLQKTANGWVKPKSGKQPGAKKEESKSAPKSLAGTPMKKADLNSKDPYEITYSMKPDTASEAKEMDKISAFMQEETGATLRNAITARESFYKNTKNPTPEQQEGLAALMKIQQKLGYGKTTEGPALNGQKKTVNHQEYRDGPMYGPAESKPVESNRENRINEYWRKIRKETQPVARMAAELDRGTFDDDVRDTMGDGQSMEDLARSLISPAFEDDGYIPQNKLDTARKFILKRYKALESDATDAAPRILTGDTRIRVRKA